MSRIDAQSPGFPARTTDQFSEDRRRFDFRATYHFRSFRRGIKGPIQCACGKKPFTTVFKLLFFFCSNRVICLQTDPLPSWSEPRNASAFGPACPQSVERLQQQDRILTNFLLDKGLRTSEDCLTLNIFTPDGEGRTPRPRRTAISIPET